MSIPTDTRELRLVPFLIAAVCISAAIATYGWRATAADSSESSFVPRTPCRLFDFRPAPFTVGPRAAPLGADESHRVQVTGDEGLCTGIPADATGVALNVTATDPTAASFVAVVPGDVEGNPGVSSLNFLPGAPPTPNKVDVALDGSGGIRVYNLAGNVYLLADVVGYYTGSLLDEFDQRLDDLEAVVEPPGPITLEQGMTWVRNGNSSDFILYYQSGAQFDGGAVGRVAHLSLVGPTEIGSTQYRLHSVTYCMTTGSEFATVDQASIVGLGPGLDSVETKDTTDRTESGCYELVASADVGARKSHHLMVVVREAVRMTSVTATWNPVS